MARVAAGALEFLIFSHAVDGPDLYGALSFFETMPSKAELTNGLNQFRCRPPPVCSGRRLFDYAYEDLTRIFAKSAARVLFKHPNSVFLLKIVQCRSQRTGRFFAQHAQMH